MQDTPSWCRNHLSIVAKTRYKGLLMALSIARLGLFLLIDTQKRISLDVPILTRLAHPLQSVFVFFLMSLPPFNSTFQISLQTRPSFTECLTEVARFLFEFTVHL